MSVISLIKEQFSTCYVHEPHIKSFNILQHAIFGGCEIHTRSGIKTLIRMLKPKFALEIGSWCFDTTIEIARVFDELYATDYSIGHIHSIDIKHYVEPPIAPRITTHIWTPHKTTWPQDDAAILQAIASLTDEQIFERNLGYLQSIIPTSGFDLIYIDGDHSYEGTAFDAQYAANAINKSNEHAVVVVDDVWDIRLHEVRKFFDDICTEKWDFYEWNLANRNKVQNMGVFIL